MWAGISFHSAEALQCLIQDGLNRQQHIVIKAWLDFTESLSWEALRILIRQQKWEWKTNVVKIFNNLPPWIPKGTHFKIRSLGEILSKPQVVLSRFDLNINCKQIVLFIDTRNGCSTMKCLDEIRFELQSKQVTISLEINYNYSHSIQ